MIKKIKLELIVLIIISLFVITSQSFDFFLSELIKDLFLNKQGVYLKEFFVNITEIGNSFWYFSAALIFLIISLALKKTTFKETESLSKIINFSLGILLYLFVAGFITQVIKHLVGRPRPNYFDTSGVFDFFTTNSNFHSFPSGHASTIFMVVIFFALIFPKISYLFYLFGFVVGISRVVVGAHFITDVLAGFVVSIIVFKLLNTYFMNKVDLLKPNKIFIFKQGPVVHFVLFLFLIIICVTVGPSFDLFFSGLFYLGENNFLLQSYHIITMMFRKCLLPFVLFYILILPFFSKFTLVNKMFFGHFFTFKSIVFIWVYFFLVLGVFINTFLKTVWGRARPDETLNFGGDGFFTPWYEISDSCSSNCSFVSGDSSVGFSIIILYFITQKNIYAYLSFVVGILLGLVRIAEGGHFLSDVLFSSLFVILLSFTFSKVYSYAN